MRSPVLPLGWAPTALGNVRAENVEQAAPGGAGAFVYVDISSIDSRKKAIIEPKVLLPDQAPSRARQRLQARDVIVSMTRPNLNAVALVPNTMQGAIGSTGFHVLRASPVVAPHWLFYLVQTDAFVEAMSGLVQGVVYPAVGPRT